MNCVCSKELNHNFLKYVLLAESAAFRRFSSGAVHQTIYFPEVKAFHICHPSIAEQKRIVATLDAARAETQRLEALYERKLDALDELKRSLLDQAFSGKL